MEVTQLANQLTEDDIKLRVFTTPILLPYETIKITQIACRVMERYNITGFDPLQPFYRFVIRQWASDTGNDIEIYEEWNYLQSALRSSTLFKRLRAQRYNIDGQNVKLTPWVPKGVDTPKFN